MRYPTACSTAKGRTARWTRSSWAIPATAKRTNAPAAKITGANNTQQTAPGFSIGRRLLCNGFSGRAEAREALRYGNKKRGGKVFRPLFSFRFCSFSVPPPRFSENIRRWSRASPFRAPRRRYTTWFRKFLPHSSVYPRRKRRR